MSDIKFLRRNKSIRIEEESMCVYVCVCVWDFTYVRHEKTASKQIEKCIELIHFMPWEKYTILLKNQNGWFFLSMNFYKNVVRIVVFKKYPWI